MYISEEQKTLEKLDADFRKTVKAANAFVKDTLETQSERKKPDAAEEPLRVHKSTYKSRLLKIENNVLIRSRTPREKVILPESVTSIDASAFKNCSKLTIYAPSGSYAEQYAKENNINFAAV